MKVLSIGNSFSQDAQHYLYKIARASGVNLKTVNLYIGGCSLRTHYLNMLEDSAAYEFEFNGNRTGIKVSISQALASDDWDVITLQQASHLSWNEKTYFPYITALADYARKYCPNAKIAIHQTWAYEDGCERLQVMTGQSSALQMLQDLQKAYAKAAQAIGADLIIPGGQAMYNATQFGMEKIHRDCFHASFGAGRYMLGLTWLKALTGKDISQDRFTELDEEVTEEQREILIKAVNAAFA